MISIIISMTIFAFIGAASPGPVNIIATTSSANYGFKRTVPHVFGASASYAFIVFTVGLGLNQLLTANPEFTEIVKYLGAAFLLYMSYKIATSKSSNEQERQEKVAPSALQGFLAQGLNPKAWLVSMSGVSLFVTPHDPASLYLILFTCVSFVICILGVGIWAAAGELLSSLLIAPKNQRMFNRLMGLLLSLTVVAMFF